mgnify:CR=1 FL=1
MRQGRRRNVKRIMSATAQVRQDHVTRRDWWECIVNCKICGRNFARHVCGTRAHALAYVEAGPCDRGVEAEAREARPEPGD